MTPEERVERLRLSEPPINLSDIVVAPAAICAAIRDAENDALERAATVAMSLVGRSCEGQSAAIAIREMKHVQ